MGLLTDAFIATEEELAAVLSQDHFSPIKFFPTVQSKNIDDFMLTRLEAIVMQEEFPSLDAEIAIIKQRMIGDDDGPWIHRFLDTLVERLAHLTAAEIIHNGQAWGAAIQHNYEKQPPDVSGIVPYFRELCQLAKHAPSERKHIYMDVALSPPVKTNRSLVRTQWHVSP